MAPDLPGHGTDETPLGEVSLQTYVDRVCQILDAQSEQVILVGHSTGGAVITQAAENRPDKVDMLIYLTAYLLRNREFIFHYVEMDTNALVLPIIVMSEDQSYATIKEEALVDVFYGNCSNMDIKFAQSRLVPQATKPFSTPVHTTDKNFGSIPRVYISCLRDKVISPEIQKKMYLNVRCNKILMIDTDHSPFFSAPDELTKHLLSV